ncbi:MAG: cyclopropane-fatty-acyl-phospholipid synthase family protein [Pseudomonadota bacterium]|nr:cyclopropane-fatty-acyl-phospholipid synthase family protein [Pseudomonadota bacterium]
MKMLNAMVGQTIRRGSLTVIDAEGGRRRHGDGGEPVAAMRIGDPAVYRRIVLNPELAVGEAYMDGLLTFEEGSVRDLLQLFHRNAVNLRARPMRRAAAEAMRRMRRFQQSNPVGKAREHVAHHYDLSNDFYRRFLDKDLNYSCAYFEHDGQSLEDAQRAKLRHIAAKLRIEPGMRVLDIGSGWGAMALYLAKHLGARVVGVTLSKEQQALATMRARERGLEGKVEFRLQDYREVEGPFDRIVSVGMFEHVGVPHYTEFFEKLSDLLAGDGLALLHAIGRKGPPDVTGPWIRKYIFPGGYSPALSETFAAIERSGLWASDIEILRLHYADTLREWERRFQANRADIAAMFDERFCRMWEFYLSTSEFAFRVGGHMVFQIQLAHERDAAPIRRDYIQQAETALKEVEADRNVSA